MSLLTSFFLLNVLAQSPFFHYHKWTDTEHVKKLHSHSVVISHPHLLPSEYPSSDSGYGIARVDEFNPAIFLTWFDVKLNLKWEMPALAVVAFSLPQPERESNPLSGQYQERSHDPPLDFSAAPRSPPANPAV
ncbi:MAG: hypothetical protein A3F68_05645 [Acidobacteria bacterium RIFCSPLOWO2_12_FULL_54_10]|nr:MAG: hypothetical protein A3F68_05645 [Acidobacteria bacterium RIFCSPLOWO2_12_FULL_54_10]